MQKDRNLPMADAKKYRDKIHAAPNSPGVYLMKNASGEIIYIGKAKSIRKRLKSYLAGGLDPKTAVLLSHLDDIEFKLTASEGLALLLEASLIGKFKPRYNISLRDDKSFPFIKITNEKFPLIIICRKKEDKNAIYFGPYTSAALLREALKIIRRYFPYRSCRRLPKKPCIYLRIGLCPGCCIERISRKEYLKTISSIILIIQGRIDELVRKFSRQMHQKSKKQEFEEAAKLRDQIYALSSVGKGQLGLNREAEISDLKKLLHLKHMPERIEAFDISNIFGKEATGSMVSFFKGEPDKDNYRRFRIKNVREINDYAMIREVVHRRYTKVVEEKIDRPDLIIIDGGRAHLNSARGELRDLKLNIPLISIAKEKEHIYTEKLAVPIKLESDTPALNLIRRIRDEAHRFAVSYHHILRRKKIIGK